MNIDDIRKGAVEAFSRELKNPCPLIGVTDGTDGETSTAVSQATNQVYRFMAVDAAVVGLRVKWG